MSRPVIILIALNFLLSLAGSRAVAAWGPNSCDLLFTGNTSRLLTQKGLTGNSPNPEIYSEYLHNRFRIAAAKEINSSQNYELRIASSLLQLAESLHSRSGGHLEGFTNGDPATLLIRQMIEHYQKNILAQAELYEANREEINLIKSTLVLQNGSTRKLRLILQEYIQEQNFLFQRIADSLVRSRLANSIHVLGEPSFQFKNNFTPLEIEMVESLIAQLR